VWHRILRLFLKLCQRTRILPMACHGLARALSYTRTHTSTRLHTVSLCAVNICAISRSLSLSLSLALSLPLSPILVHMLLGTCTLCPHALRCLHLLCSYRRYAHVTRLIPCDATGSGSHTSYAHRSLQVVRTIFSCRWYAHLTRLIPCDAAGIGSYMWYTLYVHIGATHMFI